MMPLLEALGVGHTDSATAYVAMSSQIQNHEHKWTYSGKQPLSESLKPPSDQERSISFTFDFSLSCSCLSGHFFTLTSLDPEHHKLVGLTNYPATLRTLLRDLGDSRVILTTLL